MNTYYVVRSSRPAGLFSFGLLDGLHVCLRRPYLRETSAGVRSRTPRDGIHEQSGLDRPRITNDAYPTNGYSHTYAEASRVLRFRAREFRTTALKRKMETLEEIRCTLAWRNNSTVPRTCAGTSRIMRVREERNTGGAYPTAVVTINR
jgi:hypothetical protein